MIPFVFTLLSNPPSIIFAFEIHIIFILCSSFFSTKGERIFHMSRMTSLTSNSFPAIFLDVNSTGTSKYAGENLLSCKPSLSKSGGTKRYSSN